MAHSPQKDRRPLEDIHHSLRSPASKHDRRHNERNNEPVQDNEWNDDENIYGNINPIVTPKKRRLENSKIDDTSESDIPIERKKVKTPQKTRSEPLEKSAIKLISATTTAPAIAPSTPAAAAAVAAVINTPISSPAPKIRLLGHLFSVTEEPPRSQTKKRKDPNVNEFTIFQDADVSIQIPVQTDKNVNSRNDMQKGPSEVSSTLQYASPKRTINKNIEVLSSKFTADDEEHSLKYDERNEISEASEPELQVKLNKSLSLVFEQEKSESRKAILSINEILKHIDDLQSDYQVKELRGQNQGGQNRQKGQKEQGGLKGKDMQNESQSHNTETDTHNTHYAHTPNRASKSFVDSVPSSSRNAHKNIENNEKKENISSASIGSTADDVAESQQNSQQNKQQNKESNNYHEAYCESSQYSQGSQGNDYNHIQHNQDNNQGNSKGISKSISQGTSERNHERNETSDDSVTDVSYAYILRDIERMVVGLKEKGRVPLDFSVYNDSSSTVDNDSNNNSDSKYNNNNNNNNNKVKTSNDNTIKNNTMPGVPRINVINISAATAQHREQQQSRDANKSYKQENKQEKQGIYDEEDKYQGLEQQKRQKYSGIKVQGPLKEPVISVISPSGGDIRADQMSISAPLTATVPATIPTTIRAPTPTTIPSTIPFIVPSTVPTPTSIPNANPSPSISSTLYSQTIPSQNSPKSNGHHTKGSPPSVLPPMGFSVGGIEENGEDLEFLSFHAKIAAARESSMKILLRGCRAQKDLTVVQQTTVAFYKGEVDFLSTSAILRRGEILSPLGVNGPSPTVISTPSCNDLNFINNSVNNIIHCEELDLSNTIITRIEDSSALSQSQYLSARVPLSELTSYQSRLSDWRGRYKVENVAEGSRHFPSYSSSSSSSSFPSSSSVPPSFSSTSSVMNQKKIEEKEEINENEAPLQNNEQNNENKETHYSLSSSPHKNRNDENNESNEDENVEVNTESVVEKSVETLSCDIDNFIDNYINGNTGSYSNGNIENNID